MKSLLWRIVLAMVALSAAKNVLAQSFLTMLAPCRVVDTRTTQRPTGTWGAPSLVANTERDFPMYSTSGAPCTIPPSATAFLTNVTAIPPGPVNTLAVWPTGQPNLGLSTLEAPTGLWEANAVIAPAGTGGSIAVEPSATTDFLIDTNGYFAPGSGLLFYPMAPCRVVDTRTTQRPPGTFGPPSLPPTRSFPIFQSPCGIPAAARAFSFNVTAIPPGPMYWLTVWPTDLAYPYVSTLNAIDGNWTANAAIVQAETDGNVSVEVGNTTDVIIDANGYFAPTGAVPGVNGMYFYPIPPCRMVQTTAMLQPNTTYTYAIAGGQCPVPLNTAQAFSLNVTANPSSAAPLYWLTVWPAGQPYPYVSTLNASEILSAISNAAIVPSGTNGSVNVSVGNPTNVVLDVNGYFSTSPYEGNYVNVGGTLNGGGSPGSQQQYTVHYTDPLGPSDVVYGQALFTTNPSGPDGKNACQIEWNSAGMLNLVSPSGNVNGSFGQTLSNSSCTVNASTLTSTANGYDVGLTLTFGTEFSSVPIQVYAYGENELGLSSAWMYLGVVAPAGFTITVSPAINTVNGGQSATHQVTVTSFWGFTGQVALGASNYPATTPSFSSTSVAVAANGSATSTLTVPTSYGIYGTYGVGVTGTSGSLVNSGTATVVIPPPDFTVTLQPYAQTITSGTSTTYTLSVTPIGGFSGTVYFSPSGYNMAFAFSPGYLQLPSQTQTVVTVTMTAPTGSAGQGFSITATSGSITHMVAGSVALPNNPSTLLVQTSSVPNPTVGTSYQATITASGGTSPYTWSWSGSPPAGLTLSSAGVISGTPTTAGAANFTVQVRDSTSPTNNTATQFFSLNVAQQLVITTASPLPMATANTAYSTSFGATGGTPGYNWSVNSGSLPSGLTLSSGGVLSGTPTVPGLTNFTVGTADSRGNRTSQGYTHTTAPAFAHTLVAGSASGGGCGGGQNYSGSSVYNNGVSNTFCGSSGMLFEGCDLPNQPNGVTWIPQSNATDPGQPWGMDNFSLTVTAYSNAPPGILLFQCTFQQAYFGNQSMTIPYGVYVYDATPQITNISPSNFFQGQGSVQVVIAGQNFGDTGGLSVSASSVTGLSDVTASVNSWSPNSISATLNIGSTSTGNYTLSLTESYDDTGNTFQAGYGSRSQTTAILNVSPYAGPPPPTITVSWNGTAISQNSTVYIGPVPSLSLTAALVPAQPGALPTGSVNWQANLVYKSFPCQIPQMPAVLPGAGTWTIYGSNSSEFCGGSATVEASFTWAGVQYAATFSFAILGQNPTPSAVKAALGTSPWFIQQLANSESPGYLQFDVSGNPVFGPPNGYGIMQIDFNPTTYDLWQWTTNVSDGLTYVNYLNGQTSSYWATQLKNWATYNTLHPAAPAPGPPNTTEGPCVFSNAPSGGQHPISDALWIKGYNSGPATNGTAYMWFNQQNGSWPLQNTVNGIDYVKRVCSTAP